MKKLVIMSDTHGNIGAMERIFDVMKESDLVIHLGDYARDIALFKRELSDKIISVKGNCDGGGSDEIITVENVKILLTHGDAYGVKRGLDQLFAYAKSIGANAVFYGHTHIASVTEREKVALINPGCMTRFSENSYCYAVINGEKIISTLVNAR